MTTAQKNINPAPHDSVPPQSRPSTVGSWFRSRLDAYIAVNEQAHAQDVVHVLSHRAAAALTTR